MSSPHSIRQEAYGTYRWLLREVGAYLQLPSNTYMWNHADFRRVDSIVQSGLQRFYSPPPQERVADNDEVKDEISREKQNRKPYVWSFLNQLTTLTTKAGVFKYELPGDFAGSPSDLVSNPGGERLPIVSEEHLRTLLAGS